MSNKRAAIRYLVILAGCINFERIASGDYSTAYESDSPAKAQGSYESKKSEIERGAAAVSSIGLLRISSKETSGGLEFKVEEKGKLINFFERGDFFSFDYNGAAVDMSLSDEGLNLGSVVHVKNDDGSIGFKLDGRADSPIFPSLQAAAIHVCNERSIELPDDLKPAFVNEEKAEATGDNASSDDTAATDADL